MNLKEAILQFQMLKPSTGALKQMRRKGVESFITQGLPTKALELWHYTSLKDFPENRLLPALSHSPNLSKLKSLFKDYLNPDFYNIVFVNGEFSKELSSRKISKFAKVHHLGHRQSLQVLAPLKAARKACGGDFRQNSMEALNASMATGISIRFQPQKAPQKPVHIVHIKSQSSAVYPRVLIAVGQGSSVNLIESFVGETSSAEVPEILNAVSEILVDKDARLNHLRLQAESMSTTHVGTLRVFLNQSSHYQSLTVGAGAKLGRLNLSVHCLGPHAVAQVNGLTISNGTQHLDNTTLIDHVVGDCTTSQLYKSVLGGHSKAIFCGRVQIRKDAQKASSEQLNQNLLLSEKAEANSKPELGIYADDVKASHGSSIGQISKEEVFYLMSRAISQEQAIEMLSLAFIQELVDRWENEKVRAWLSQIVISQFRRLQKGSP